MYCCSGSWSAAATPAPFGTPSGPGPSSYAPPSRPIAPASTPIPAYASWMIGRWSDSDCSRFMEFRSDGTATTANGQPATFTVTPNGVGVGIVIQGGSQRVDGYLDPDGDSGATLHANGRNIPLRRC